MSFPVPYLRSLDGGPQPGQTIFIKGYMLGDRFDVNLKTGPSESDDYGLHVSCRANPEGKFCVNTTQGGPDQWQEEERHRMNIKVSDDFEMRIRFHEDKFEVFSQGKEVFTFDYRHPITSLTHLYVEGDVELHRVTWEGRYYEIPFSSPIKLIPGKPIFVAGVVKKGASRFEVDFKVGEDFALHLNPRFDQKCIVRNHTEGGPEGWGNEERDGNFTLERNRTFDIIIGITDGGYEIFLDGVPYCTFSHRYPLEQVDTISIAGDVELQGIHW